MTAVPVGSMIADFEPVTLTVERATGASADYRGRVVRSGTSTVSMLMAVHQTSRKQLERAGLDYGHDYRSFYSESELRTVVPGPADIIQHEGARWEIVDVANYLTMGEICFAIGKRIE